MNLKEINKLVRKSKQEGRVLILNFSGKELHYAHRDWIVKDL